MINPCNPLIAASASNLSLYLTNPHCLPGGIFTSVMVPKGLKSSKSCSSLIFGFKPPTNTVVEETPAFIALLFTVVVEEEVGEYTDNPLGLLTSKLLFCLLLIE